MFAFRSISNTPANLRPRPYHVLFARHGYVEYIDPHGLIMNRFIRAPQVRLLPFGAIDEYDLRDGEDLQIVAVEKARTSALNASLDLIQIDKEPIPLCILMDSRKYCYYQNRLLKHWAKENRPTSTVVRFNSRFGITVLQ